MTARTGALATDSRTMVGWVDLTAIEFPETMAYHSAVFVLIWGSLVNFLTFRRVNKRDYAFFTHSNDRMSSFSLALHVVILA